MRLLVTTTLNPNLLRGLLQPILAVPEVAEVILVADTYPLPLPQPEG